MLEDIYYDMAAVIRRHREAKGLTQQELSEAVGYKGSGAISGFENCRSRIGMHTLVDVCEVLGADPVQVWGEVLDSYKKGQQEGFSACASS